MRILLFAMARSRSTFLSDIIAQHYEYNNLFEPYHGSLTGIINQKFNIHQRKERWEAYLEAAKTTTKKLSERDNFIVKLFPDVLYDFYKYGENSISRYYKKNMDKLDCLPILEHYNIEMYDLMYATYRSNKIDNACSYLTASKHNEFLFYSKQQAKFYAPKKIKLNYYDWMIEHLAFNDFYYYLNLEILKKFNPNIICLDYDEIPDYVNKNFPHIKSSLVDAKYDYKNNILNYDEIAYDYMAARKEIEENCRDLLS